ncbi:uncharacterized protein LOC136043481, partial [Artemia franciscana]|uniref:uncharacterized protein LOC136043481 n=1 Tax=Artemia franciscana TaxID=6661 RepID=UPI0032DBEFB8
MILEERVKKIESRLDDIEQENRLDSLIFSGVKQAPGADVKSCINNIISDKMGVQVYVSELTKVYRFTLPENPTRPDMIAPVLAQFSSKDVARKVFAAKSKLAKSGIFVSESLTKKRREILQLARDRLGYTLISKNRSLMGRGGLAFIIKDDIKFKVREDLSLWIEDFRKAFDTVDFNTLLSRLSGLGLGSTCVKWFSSYLHGRTIKVALSDISSREFGVKCGVPQGSVLGPLLYLIYVNSLASHVGVEALTSFADDTAITVTGSCLVQVAHKANLALERLRSFTVGSSLAVNASKTNYIIFSRT